METTLFSEVTTLIRKTLKKPDLQIGPQDSPDSIQGWDSLYHALLIDQLQKQFQIRFSLDQLLEMHTVEDICRAITHARAK